MNATAQEAIWYDANASARSMGSVDLVLWEVKKRRYGEGAKLELGSARLGKWDEQAIKNRSHFHSLPFTRCCAVPAKWYTRS